MNRCVPTAAIALALVVGACASDPDATAAVGKAAGAGGIVGAFLSSSAGVPADAGIAMTTQSSASKHDSRKLPKDNSAAEASRGPGQAAAPPTSLPPVTQSGSPGFPLRVTITPPCVTPGATLQLLVETRPHSSIAAAVAYSDNQAHGAMQVAKAASDGSWRWNVVVSPKAPQGPARALISAQDRAASSNDDGASTNGEGAKGTFPFEVRSRC